MQRREFLAGAALTAVRAQSGSRFVGITVMPEYLQSEGIEQVLGNLRRAGATAVATSPYVMAPSEASGAQREPPIDAGAGGVRLLDRPLWGRRELRVATAPSFGPDESLYRGLRFQPVPPSELTRAQGEVVGQFIHAAKAGGLKVYFQIQAASPPGYRVQFGGPDADTKPRLPDGRLPTRGVANNGSLASAEIRRYTEALILDLCRQYPEIDGIRVDWPEYPPYFLDDAFLDFSNPAREAATRLGFDFERMRADAAQAYAYLHGSLTDRDLAGVVEEDGGLYALLHTLTARSGLVELMRFKASLVEELLAGFRQACAEKELMPNAFPPPFSLVSGMDFTRAGRHSAAISVKLYTMHWPMILRFYGDTLLQANPRLSSRLLTRALVRLMDIEDAGASDRLEDYRYPDPDTPHPVGLEAQGRKIRQARLAAGACPIIALAHGYGPLADFRRRLRKAYEAAERRVWVNRYGYLSDEKIAAIGEVCAS
jgi:hypothetical protein